MNKLQQRSSENGFPVFRRPFFMRSQSNHTFHSQSNRSVGFAHEKTTTQPIF
ncbi:MULTISPECIES: hypothetical protein [Neisseria]|uniref:hypothetical protein n=1 Tax=Neisseria TaxID=482 RepID=UPI0016498A25|nr:MULTISPECIES: hypothetical protein [Neisseria]